MEFINPYSIPAIAALALKLVLLWVVNIMPLRTAEARVFLAFLAVLALHNFAEIMVFNYSGPQDGIIPLRSGLLYFTMSVVAMAVLVHLMLIRLKTSTGWNVPLRHWKLLYVPAGVVLFMLWTSNDMIRGFVQYGFAYTRVPGPLYGWFEASALAYLTGSMLLLGIAAVFSTSRAQRRKNVIAAFGMAPIIVMPIVVIVLQRAGLNVFNLPMWFALALTFFLAVMAYAIYEHRLFDVFFHLPGTRLHSRRTSFHKGIRDLIAELDNLPPMSVEETLNRLATTLRCSVALVGRGREPLDARPLSGGAEHLELDKLQRGELERIDDIVLTKEARNDQPALYSMLSGANCAAVIPFRPFKETSAGWLLLGGGKAGPDELPIDFATVESLFDRMGDLFLDHIVREREALHQVQRELDAQAAVNERLRNELARKDDTIDSLYDQIAAPGNGSAPAATLDELTAGLERKMICSTLAQLKGNVSATAKALGITRQTLYAKMDNYGIDSKKWRKRRGQQKS